MYLFITVCLLTLALSFSPVSFTTHCYANREEKKKWWYERCTGGTLQDLLSSYPLASTITYVNCFQGETPSKKKFYITHFGKGHSISVSCRVLRFRACDDVCVIAAAVSHSTDLRL